MITFIQSVDYPGSNVTLLTGISNLGVIAGFTGDRGFLLEGGAFTPIKYPTDRATAINELNAAGQAVGYFYTDSYLQGFVYENGAFSFFDYPGALYADPIGINDDGDIVGYYATGTEDQGFVYSDGAFQPLDYPGAYATIPLDINNNDQIVGFFAEGPPGFDYGGGFLLSDGVYTEISIPGAILTRPSGINDAGVIVGDYVTAAEVGTQNHGFLYANGVFHTFDYPGAAGWPGTLASDINNQGQIVGHWYDQLGTHGFLAAMTLANAPPVAEADVAAVQARGATAGNVLANDHDPDGDPLVVSAVEGAAPGVAITGAYGSLLLNADGSYAYTAFKTAGAPHGLAQDRFSYSVADGFGGTDQATLTITITQKGQDYLAGTPGEGAGALTAVNGGNGKDVLDGSLGLQHLFGGNGADMLIGGPGDLLTGGRGADVFVLGTGSGHNLITDFTPGQDALQLDAGMFSSFDAVLQSADQVGSDVVIALDSASIVTLAGVNLSGLSAADVILL